MPAWVRRFLIRIGVIRMSEAEKWQALFRELSGSREGG